MKQIGDLIKNYKKEQIKVFSKKDAITYIAQLVDLSMDRLKNWKIVAYKLRDLSAKDATEILYSVRKGMREDTENKTGQFLYITDAIIHRKRPKQLKIKL